MGIFEEKAYKGLLCAKNSECGKNNHEIGRLEKIILKSQQKAFLLSYYRWLFLGRCHFNRKNSKVHGKLIFNIINFRGISMIYTIKWIDEDLDFGCEERLKGMPVMTTVTLMNSSGEEFRIKAEDVMLYKCNINEGGKVYFDVNNKLEKIKIAGELQW